MHQFIDDMQEHWPIALLFVGMAWGFVVWIWSKLVSSPKDLRECRKEVAIEFTNNAKAHNKIYDKMELNHKEVMQAFIDHLSSGK